MVICFFNFQLVSYVYDKLDLTIFNLGSRSDFVLVMNENIFLKKVNTAVM